MQIPVDLENAKSGQSIPSRGDIQCTATSWPIVQEELKPFGTVGSQRSRCGHSFEKTSFHMKARDLNFSHLPVPKGTQGQDSAWNKREKLLKLRYQDCMQWADLQAKDDLKNAVIETAWSIWENTSTKMKEEKREKWDPEVKFIWVGNVEKVSTILWVSSW